MAIAKKALYLAQFGAQTVIGTSVPATFQIQPMALLDQSGATVERPMSQVGFLAESTGQESIVENMVPFSIEEHPITFEEAMLWFSMSVEGNVSAVDISGGMAGPAWLWAHIRDNTTLPNIELFTLEAADFDGTITTADEFPDAFLTDWTINIQSGALTTFSANGIANPRVASALTNLPSFPLDVEHIKHSCWGIYIDDSGSLGNTLYADDILTATLAFRSGFTALRTTKEVCDGSYAIVDFNPEDTGFDLDITAFAKPGASELYELERDAAEAQTIRAIRIKAEGAALLADAGPDTQNKLLRFDVVGKHVNGTVIPAGDDSGQRTLEIKIKTSIDTSSSAWFAAYVQNTMPDLSP